MGSIWSGTWARAQFKKPVFVEQCWRIRTPRCPKCKRAVKYVYSLPTDGEHFFCRLCLGVKYRSQYAKSLKNHQRRLVAAGERIERSQQQWEAQARARYEVVNPIEPPTMSTE